MQRAVDGVDMMIQRRAVDGTLPLPSERERERAVIIFLALGYRNCAVEGYDVRPISPAIRLGAQALWVGRHLAAIRDTFGHAAFGRRQSKRCAGNRDGGR